MHHAGANSSEPCAQAAPSPRRRRARFPELACAGSHMHEAVAPALLVAALLAVLLRPAWLDAVDRRSMRWLRRPRSTGAWCGWMAAAALLGQLAVTLVAGVPKPAVHDERSFLIAADTFARGRLANPTHPLWQHFETFHVLLQPTYASKYPPGQGLALALGQVVGIPLLGVWLSGAAFAAAACWMLRGWLRPPAARLASAVVVATLVVATPWSHGYWGGFVAAASGALLFGALPRLQRRPNATAGLALGVGLAGLAMSRPWEGAVAAAAALLALLWTALRQPGLRAVLLRRAALPALLVVTLAAGWLALYQLRVTGSPWTMPYRLYDQRYASTPVFLWQQPREVAPSPHPDMARYFRDFEGESWAQQHTLGGWGRAALGKSADLWAFYAGAALTPALLAVPWTLRRRRPRFAVMTLLALLASQLVIVPSRPHYVAPAACLVAYLLVEGWRQLRQWRPGGVPMGRRLAAALPWILLAQLPVRAVVLRPAPHEWPAPRETVAARLAALPGRQLVVVRYGPAHDPQAEWLANGADLFGARVLWARSMGAAEDCRLLAYEFGRTAWLLDVVEDVTPPRLVRYPRTACAGVGIGVAASPNTTRLPSTRQGSPSSRRSASG